MGSAMMVGSVMMVGSASASEYSQHQKKISVMDSLWSQNEVKQN